MLQWEYGQLFVALIEDLQDASAPWRCETTFNDGSPQAPNPADNGWVPQLNQLGTQGWELVSERWLDVDVAPVALGGLRVNDRGQRRRTLGVYSFKRPKR